MVRYKMELNVPAEMVAPIFELLAKDGVVVSVEPIIKSGERSHHKVVGLHRRREGKTRIPGSNGFTAIELLKKLVVEGGETRLSVIKKEFVKNDFAETSVGPTVSVAVREGWLKKVDRDTVGRV